MSQHTSIQQRVAAALNREVVAVQPLSGGCVGEVYRVELAVPPEGGVGYRHGEQPAPRRVVVKSAAAEEAAASAAAAGFNGLALEGQMLRELAARSALPVPAVLHSESSLLIIEYIEHSGAAGNDRIVARDAAERLAKLHAIGPQPEDGASNDDATGYGFPYETLIGALPQPNAWMTSWPSFFAERRLRFMASLAAESGRLPKFLRQRVERVADAAEELLALPNGADFRRPSLIHGDIWSGNVLLNRDRVAAFIDPAIYFADPEIELAFITLFSTFGRAFFQRYAELRPAWAAAAEGFFAKRRDIYNLYPLLVHVRLFGSGYVNQLDSTLRRLA